MRCHLFRNLSTIRVNFDGIITVMCIPGVRCCFSVLTDRRSLSWGTRHTATSASRSTGYLLRYGISRDLQRSHEPGHLFVPGQSSSYPRSTYRSEFFILVRLEKGLDAWSGMVAVWCGRWACLTGRQCLGPLSSWQSPCVGMGPIFCGGTVPDDTRYGRSNGVCACQPGAAALSDCMPAAVPRMPSRQLQRVSGVWL